MTLLVELGDGKGKWVSAGEVLPGASGSMSDHSQGKREIIMFSCEGEHSEVWRSIGGVDIERGPMREVLTLGRKDIVTLHPNDAHETTLQTDKMRSPARLRFTHKA